MPEHALPMDAANESRIAIVRHAAVMAAILAACLAIYGGTFGYPFSFDDEINITANQDVQGISAEHASETGDGWQLRVSGRPLGYLTFALNYRLGGLFVRGYHAVNFAIHAISAWLCYALALKLLGASCGSAAPRMNHQSAAALAALIFAAHPLQTQAVTYIVQRLTSLSAMWYLLALVMYLMARTSRARPASKALLMAISLGAYALSMLTKENAVTLLPIIAIIEAAILKGGWRERARFVAPVAAMSMLVPLMLLDLKSGGGLIDQVASRTRLDSDLSRGAYLLTEFRVLLTYLRLFLLPMGQNVDYDYPSYPALPLPSALASLAALACVTALAIWLLRKPGEHRVAGIGLLWFFAALSVESSVIPIRDVIFEHRMYLPMVGLSMAMAAGAMLAIKDRKMALAGLCVLIVLMAAAAHARNGKWSSGAALWEDAVAKSPNKARPHHNLATEYDRAGRGYDAVTQYKEALRIDPGLFLSHINLGLLFASKGQFMLAKEHFERAAEIKPDSADSHANLCSALYDLGRIEKAETSCKRALELSPEHSNARFNLALVLIGLGRFGQATSLIDRIGDTSPLDAKTLRFMLREAAK